MKKCAAILFIVWASGAAVAAAQQQDLPPGWTPGPIVGTLGNRGTLDVPDGYLFLDSRATRTFLDENQNIPDGSELGTVLRILPNDDFWFAVFSYSDTGHIDNSDRNSLDAGALMESMMEGNRQNNEERQKRGWPSLTLLGWQRPPYYDSATDNLTWATKLNSDGSPIVNHSVRLLGRTGLMSAQLVADVNGIDTATREFDEVLRGYTFVEGQRYAEFRQGDKLAGYGLTALIAGGAGAAAVKVGLFKKLWKFLVLGFVALAGGLKKLLSVFSRSGDQADPATVPGTQGH